MADEEKKVIKVSLIPLTDKEIEEQQAINQKIIDESNDKIRASISAANIVKADKVEKSAEEKEYLLLFVDIEDSNNTWFSIEIGRTDTYEEIKSCITEIDIHLSTVLVEGLPLEKRVSVYAFMKHMQDKGFFDGDSFDIEDYNIGDEQEEDYPNDVSDTNYKYESEDDGIQRVTPFIHLDSDSQDI